MKNTFHLFSGRQTLAIRFGLAFLGLILSGCHQTDAPANGVRIATTTSYLEAAARDLMGNEVCITRLAEPGTCPGHFDIRPSQVADIRKCSVLLRFDFQKSMDEKLTENHPKALRVAEIAIRGGMGCPESYLSACKQTAEHLVALNHISRTNAESRIQAIESRLSSLAQTLANRVQTAGLAGSSVITSAHQREFCEWLGLKVAASFRAADNASIGEIEAAIKAGSLAQIKHVIANQPEGRRVADALAARLKATVTVFGNFPSSKNDPLAFDKMVMENVQALVQSATK